VSRPLAGFTLVGWFPLGELSASHGWAGKAELTPDMLVPRELVDDHERMVREGEMHAAEDQKRREDIETRNQADTLAYQADKTLRDYGDKIPADIREEINGKVAAVRSALQGQDVAYIRRTMQDLSYAMQKIGSAVYGQPGSPGGPGGPGPGAGGPPPGGEQPRRPEEGTVEGEYREV